MLTSVRLKLTHAGMERAIIHVEITLVHVIKGSEMMVFGSALLTPKQTTLP